MQVSHWQTTSMALLMLGQKKLPHVRNLTLLFLDGIDAPDAGFSPFWQEE